MTRHAELVTVLAVPICTVNMETDNDHWNTKKKLYQHLRMLIMEIWYWCSPQKVLSSLTVCVSCLVFGVMTHWIRGAISESDSKWQICTADPFTLVSFVIPKDLIIILHDLVMHFPKVKDLARDIKKNSKIHTAEADVCCFLVLNIL